MLSGKDPEFSVIISVYNKARFVGQALESVLRQTYRDLEVIVVDDGSTDASKDVVASFHDQRIRYVYQENSGLPACARNKGMELSRGKYIALLDGDDYWHEEKLERCKAILDKLPEVDLVCHNIAFIYHGKTLKITRFGPYVEKMYDKLLFGGNCLGPSAVAIRRKVFFDDGFRFNEDKSLFALEDYEYWLQLSRKCRFYFLADVLGYYTATDSGAFSKDTEGNAVNMLRLLDRHFARFDSSDTNIRKLIKKRRASVMCAAGRMYNHQKSFEDSRRWYIRALNENPFSFKACVGYVMGLARFSVIYK
jgi:glycosyltransferase involved in cell wall biosynthesis